MKLFLAKTCFFLFLLFALLQITSSSNPYYFGNKAFESKLNVFNSSPVQFNSVFFGSSHVYRQINPKLFDSKTDVNIKSFNFGIIGTYGIESLYLLKNFLAKNKSSDQIKYVFFELQHPQKQLLENYKSLKSHYYIDRHSLGIAKRTFLNNDFKLFSEYLLCSIYRSLHFRAAIPPLTTNSSRSHKFDKQGFLDLDTEIDNFKTKGLVKRRKEFALKSKSIIRSLQSRPNNEQQIDNISSSILAEISKLSTEYPNIRFISFKHPLAKQLNSDKINGIEILNIPESILKKNLFNDEFLFDRGHLNREGSTRYTSLLAKQFNKVTKGGTSHIATESSHTVANHNAIEFNPLNSITPSDLSSQSQIIKVNQYKNQVTKGEILAIQGDIIKVTGFAIDSPNESLASAIYFKMNSKFFKATYGNIPKKQIAKRLKDNKYLNCGFEIEIPTSELAHGLHKMEMYVISADNKQYYKQKKTLQIEILKE